MMMISQCVTFQPYSIGYWPSWNKNKSDGSPPTTTSKCDWTEIQDMISFQQLTRGIAVKDGWPDVVGSHIPLSVLFAAHHNLVAYGVAFADSDGIWVNPDLTKRYYVPEDVIKVIASGTLFQNDSNVTQWVHNPPADLIFDVPNAPGMRAWVQRANSEWTRLSNMSKTWQASHISRRSSLAVPGLAD